MAVKELKQVVKGNIWFLLLLLIMVLFPFITDQLYILGLLITIFLFGAFAASYDLLLGFTGIISFGHALFFGAGAYTMGLIVRNNFVPLWAAFLTVMLVGSILAFLKGLFTLRVRGIYYAMVTLAFAQFFWVLAQKWSRVTGGDDGLPGIATPAFISERVHFYYFALAFLALTYIVIRRAVNSPTGRVLVGIRENEDRMLMLGYNVFLYKVFSLCLSGIIAALAGALYVLYINFAYPALLDIQNTIDVLMMTIVGGVATLHGPIFGAAVVRLLAYFLSSHFRQWIIIFGIIYIAIVVFMPRGIFGGLSGLDRWLGRQKQQIKWFTKRLRR